MQANGAIEPFVSMLCSGANVPAIVARGGMTAHTHYFVDFVLISPYFPCFGIDYSRFNALTSCSCDTLPLNSHMRVKWTW